MSVAPSPEVRADLEVPRTDEARQPHPTEQVPLYFGSDARPLFGWLHRPAQSHAAALGLVLCNPFGNEAICSHRSLLHFAAAAARAGIPALRFDYDGSGDSEGHDFEPDRVAAWVNSVRAAADEIRATTGVGRVAILGIRLGATLGALGALDRTDVAGLIAIAPVLSGKAYVRELRLLNRAMEAKSNATARADSDVMQAGGFAMSAQTRDSLSEIDLKRLSRPPAPRVLFLDRAELPAGDAWTQHLRDTGAQAERLAVPGYTEMMLDSHETVIPQDMIATTVTWLTKLAAEAGSAARERVMSRPGTTSRETAVLRYTAPFDPITGEPPHTTVEEYVARFGDDSKLFGIVSAPLSQRRDSAATTSAVLLLNAGAVHHVGPNRLYVALARHLARSGHVVLRMDLAGLGDSPADPGERENVVYSKFALRDIGKALEYLRREWGARDVCAVGLCSGAYHAFKAAVSQMPLNQAVMINPLTFFWKEGMSLEYPEHRVAADMVRYRTNARRMSSWLKLFRGGVNIWELGQVLARHSSAWAREVLRGPARLLGTPFRDDLPSELLTALQAPVRLHFVFAANDPGVEILRAQGGRTAQRLLARQQLGMEYVVDADHTFTDLAARATLARALCRILNDAPGS